MDTIHFSIDAFARGAFKSCQIVLWVAKFIHENVEEQSVKIEKTSKIVKVSILFSYNVSIGIWDIS